MGMAATLGALLLRRLFSREGNNETLPLSFIDWAKQFQPGMTVNYNGKGYQAFQLSGYGGQQYGSNAVVFACESTRLLLFSQVRFAFQEIEDGRAGDLIDRPRLGLLTEPWAGAHTSDLLGQAEMDVFACGNSYWVKGSDGGLLRLDPARTSILYEGIGGAEIDQVGYIGERIKLYVYQYGPSPDDIVSFLPDEVAHYKPYKSPSNQHLGQAWLTPCLSDVQADYEMTNHKIAQLQNGARIPYVVTHDKDLSDESFDAFVEWFQKTHQGTGNSGKALHLGPGSDVKTVGQTFEQLAVQAVQGAGELRIVMCSGVPAVIVGSSVGLDAASQYNNYGQARRSLVDELLRPLWGQFCGAFESLFPSPDGQKLWYDDRDVAVCREDVKEQAETFSVDIKSLSEGIKAGFKADALINAVRAYDIGRLKGQHSGLVSVQMQELAAAPKPSPGEQGQLFQPKPPPPNGKKEQPVPAGGK